MDMTVTEVSVGFRGEGAGTAEMTWGQQRVWRAVRKNCRTMNLVTVVPLAEGTAVEEMVMLLRSLVSRHPALRTLLRLSDRPSGCGYPCQVVAESGEVPLQIVDIDDGDAAAAAEHLRDRYEHAWYDEENEFPIRMGVVRLSGVLRFMVVGFNHVMVDGGGLVALARDMNLVDRGTGAGAGPPTVLDQLELARFERGPAGRRQTDRCLRYWRTQLDRLTPWSNHAPDDPREPRHWELIAYSPAMQLGLRAIAARTQTSSTYPLLAAYAVAVARVMGRNPCVAQIVVSNRFRPGFADAVLQVSQPGICVVDAAAASFDEVVSRAMTAVSSASFFGYYDPVACDELVDEFAGRGHLDIDWHLNDRRALFTAEEDAGSPDVAKAQAALREALPRTELFWRKTTSTSDGGLFLQVDTEASTLTELTEIDRSVPAICLQAWTDTHQFALHQIEAVVREMEAVTVAAAFDAAAPTDVG
jgi:hypothetical protein